MISVALWVEYGATEKLKMGYTALIDHGIQGRIEGHIRTEYSLPFKRAVTDSRLSV